MPASSGGVIARPTVTGGAGGAGNAMVPEVMAPTLAAAPPTGTSATPVSNSTFRQRRIDVTFSLAQGVFDQSGGANTVTISGLKIEATITKAGNAMKGNSQFRIYGLSQSVMNSLSTFGKAPGSFQSPASVKIMAGDVGGGLSVVYDGDLITGEADYSQMPDTVFNVECLTGRLAAATPVPPTSIAGSTDVATVMQSLAKTMGYSFENNGVSVKLANPYFWGTAWTQAQECAVAAGINWTIDNSTLIIWPANASRMSDPIGVSPDTGMIGYPAFIPGGVRVHSLFNPAIQFGRQIQVTSSLPQASGTWTVVSLVYELASETPDGPWFMTMDAWDPRYAPPI